MIGFVWIAFSSLMLLLLAVVISIIRPAIRVWPPPSRASWQYWSTWILTTIATIGILGLGVSDWGNYGVPFIPRLLGGILSVAGGLFALAAIRELGMRTTQGLGGELVTSGPYQYSRNPQYVGDALLLVGFAIVSDSLLTLIASGIAALCLLLTPLAEEPWLSKQLGDEYSKYLSEVSRYIRISI